MRSCQCAPRQKAKIRENPENVEPHRLRPPLLLLFRPPAVSSAGNSDLLPFSPRRQPGWATTSILICNEQQTPPDSTFVELEDKNRRRRIDRRFVCVPRAVHLQLQFEELALALVLERRRGRDLRGLNLNWDLRDLIQTWGVGGSFSAVLKPIFAAKHSLESV